MDSSFKLIHDATNISSDELIGFKSTEEYNRALIHTENLIQSAILLFKSGFFAQSLFFTISAIEEFAKIEVCMFRGRAKTEKVKRHKDSLFNHSKKHQISANEVILIGDRLNKSLGGDRAKQIFEDLQNGKYGKIRENCLYFSRNEDGLNIPTETISLSLTAELLLVCIEMMDDKFWGMSKNATDACERLNQIYPEIEEALNIKINTTHNRVDGL